MKTRHDTGPHNLFVCSLRTVRRRVRELTPSRVISILGASDGFSIPDLVGVKHLRLEFDDVVYSSGSYVAANARHIEQLLAFISSWSPRERMVLHCLAGSSRSPVAALIAMAAKDPGKELEHALNLRRIAPQAQPNERLIRLGDEALGAGGRLISAVTQMPFPRGVARTDLISLYVPLTATQVVEMEEHAEPVATGSGRSPEDIVSRQAVSERSDQTGALTGPSAIGIESEAEP